VLDFLHREALDGGLRTAAKAHGVKTLRRLNVRWKGYSWACGCSPSTKAIKSRSNASHALKASRNG